MKKVFITLSVVYILLIFPHFLYAQISFPAPDKYCLSCHHGIAPIRQHNSGMMKEIYEIGKKAGDPNGCIVCHGGNPAATKASLAHQGTVKYFLNHKGPKNYYPDPGSSWINQNTCAQCHKEQVGSQMNSLMMTEQGKIQGTLWSFGGMEGYNHNIGNYVTANPDDPHARLGTEVYQKYMQALHDKNPQVYPSKMKKLPPAPTADEVEKNPQLAASTCVRNVSVVIPVPKAVKKEETTVEWVVHLAISLIPIMDFMKGKIPALIKMKRVRCLYTPFRLDVMLMFLFMGKPIPAYR